MSSAGATGAVGAVYDPSHHFKGHSEPPPSIPANPMSAAISEVSRLAHQVGELRCMIDGLLDHIDAMHKGIIDGDLYFDPPKVVERARLLVGRSNG